MNSLRSLLVWAFTWAYMAVAGVVLLPWGVATGNLTSAYAAARLGVHLLFWLAGVRIVVSGREHLDRLAGASGRVFMANHQSNLDPPVLLATLPGQVSYLAKKELFSVPVLGAILHAGGIIPVDRSHRDAARASVAHAAGMARQGRPFAIFPEGTRSPDDRLLPFRKGAFHFAEQAGVPVVAVTIAGSGRLMPRGQWRIHPGVIRVTIHPPIAVESWRDSPEPRTALAGMVRERLQAGL